MLSWMKPAIPAGKTLVDQSELVELEKKRPCLISCWTATLTR